jgi:hypothetical protein
MRALISKLPPIGARDVEQLLHDGRDRAEAAHRVHHDREEADDDDGGDGGALSAPKIMMRSGATARTGTVRRPMTSGMKAREAGARA